MKKVLIARFNDMLQPYFWDMTHIDMKCSDDLAIVQNKNGIQLVKIIGVTTFDDDEPLGTKKVLMTLSSTNFKTE